MNSERLSGAQHVSLSNMEPCVVSKLVSDIRNSTGRESGTPAYGGSALPAGARQTPYYQPLRLAAYLASYRYYAYQLRTTFLYSHQLVFLPQTSTHGMKTDESIGPIRSRSLRSIIVRWADDHKTSHHHLGNSTKLSILPVNMRATSTRANRRVNVDMFFWAYMPCCLIFD